jgi:hypothetical protein
LSSFALPIRAAAVANRAYKKWYVHRFEKRECARRSIGGSQLRQFGVNARALVSQLRNAQSDCGAAFHQFVSPLLRDIETKRGIML